MELSSIIIQLYISIFLYVIGCLIGLAHASCDFCVKNKTYIQWYFYFLVLNVIIYCNGGDYWSNRLWVLDPVYRDNDTHIEQFYLLIVRFLPSIFILFRLVVWGTGLFLYTKICERFKINIVCALSLFAILYVEHYSYARASLGIMTAIWGFSFWCDKSLLRNQKFFLKNIGIIILSCSMHSSIIGLWAILACSYYLRFNAVTLIILLLSFEPLCLFFNNFLIPNIVHIVDTHDIALNANYISGEFNERDLSGLSRYYSASLLMLGYCYYKLFKYKVPPHIEHFIMATILILYVASLFLSLKMGNSNTTALRFFLMAYPSGLITCAYAIQQSFTAKKVVVLILLWGTFYSTHLYYKNLNDPVYLFYTYCRANGKTYLIK